LFEGVLYFGWPNQPSSGTMGRRMVKGRIFGNGGAGDMGLGVPPFSSKKYIK